MSRYSSPRSPRSPQDDPLAQQLPLVSGRWLLRWLLIIFGGGLALVYLTLCLLFWQGQWQILFQRTQPIAAAAPLPETAQPVLFDTTESGQPRLAGIFLVPENPAAAARTVLYLPDPSASGFETARRDLALLEQAGLQVFAFNYRGTIAGQPDHPSEATAAEDSEAAWQYLIATRHIAPQSIVLYGSGLGASLAAQLAAEHADAGGLIMDNPSAPALALLATDPRSHWLPLRLLSHDRFDPTDSLRTARPPKLFLFAESAPSSVRNYAAIALAPKRIFELSPASPSDADRAEALKRFVDELPPASPSK